MQVLRNAFGSPILDIMLESAYLNLAIGMQELLIHLNKLILPYITN